VRLSGWDNLSAVAGAPVHVIDVSVHGRTYDAGWEHGVRREARTTYGAIRLPPPEADATMLHVRLWWGGYQPPHSRPREHHLRIAV
jgi:hypothetical protein